ncbi:MAG: GDSL family lipase [Burkholderiaceae bacterium]|jgi:phospholipase/lecithinase/hemolysin|nr:GDSL family lipase [Burkholderiaceae bacterium]
MTELLTSSRRTFLAWAGSSAALLLAGCGGSSVASRMNPQRFLIVGDGFCDQGQTGSLPTVNDGSATWLQQMATYYDRVAPVKPANQGGTAWAQAYALLASADTVSGTNAPSVQTQISQMLAATTITDNDLVFINGGMADIMQAVTQTGISTTTTNTVQAAASTLAAQVLQLTQSGGTHVVVTGVYDLSLSPWAAKTGLNKADISKLTVAFNDQLLIAINDLGSSVLYLDAALFYNLVYSSPGDYGVNNTTAPVCTTPTALTCTTSTVANSSYNTYMFADDIHFTPAVQLMFGSSNYGSNGYQRLIDRW